MRKLVTRLMILFVLPAATACAAAPSPEDHTLRLCDELRPLLMQPIGLRSYAVDGNEVEEGVWEIPGFDIDGDQVADKIVRSCPGSASIIPADPCTLEFTPSSVGKRFVLEEQGLYVAEYKSHLYVVTGRKTTEDGPLYLGTYDLTSTGASKLCSFEK